MENSALSQEAKFNNFRLCKIVEIKIGGKSKPGLRIY